MWSSVALILMTALLAAGCSDPKPRPDTKLARGAWGGRNISMIVTEVGANLTFRCGAQGVIRGPIEPDAAGQFDLEGTYDPILVVGGPRPARYAGSVSGSSLTLTVFYAGSTLGPFSAALGVSPTYDPCSF